MKEQFSVIFMTLPRLRMIWTMLHNEVDTLEIVISTFNKDMKAFD